MNKPDMVTNVNVESEMSDHNLVVFDVNLKPTIIKIPPRCVYRICSKEET